MCDKGRLVGGAPPRSWRSTVRRYHRWSDVLPSTDLGRWSEAPATIELVRRYVDGYGPVTVDDISWWTGLTKERCRRALDAIDVAEVTVEGWPGPLYRTTEGLAVMESDAVRALPMLDPYVQGYRHRQRFLEDGRHDYVYDGGGNATATLVHRGGIIGVWQATQRPAQVRYHLFHPQPASLVASAERDLAAAGALLCDGPADVVAVAEMTPLSTGRSASHPLDGQLHRSSRRPTP
jgi:hypothetical protein